MLRWNRYVSNYIILIFFFASAVWLWGSGKSSIGMFWYTPWVYLAQVTGIISITAFSLSCIFSTRLSVIWVIFGELEYIYRIHKVCGIIGFISMILHVAFLYVRSISFPNLMSYYFLPGSSWSLDFGRLSFVVFLVIVLSTFIKQIPYHIWKKIHYLTGPAFVLAAVHSLTVMSDTKFNMPLRYWTIGLVTCGTLSAIYIRVFYRRYGPHYNYVVNKVENVAKNMYLIDMKPLDAKLTYHPAQFAFFSFHSKELGRETHPFTIVSTDDSDSLKIICKQLGDFSNKLPKLEIGAKVDVWGPYGVFWDDYEIDKHEQVWIARGVGITPFISMLNYESKRPLKTKKWLFYSTRSKNEDLPDEFLGDVLPYTNVKLVKHYSDEEGYLTIEHLKKHVPELKNKVFFICGPVVIDKYFFEKLCEYGVDPSNIVYEDFDIR